MKQKVLKKVLVVLFAFVLTGNVFANSEVIIQNGVDSLYDEGPGFASKMIVAGDSYAQHFYEDEKTRGIRLIGYFHEGLTLEENREALLTAFNSYCKIIFFSVSVNDRHKSTHPSYFEKEYREYLDIAKATGKIVLVHSYMYYDMASSTRFPFTPTEYDAMIRKIIMDYDNVYYVDMSDCTGLEYMLPDGIHYNKKFNDIMYDRIALMIELIRNKLI